MIAFVAPGPIELIVVLFMAIIAVLPFWMISSKAGFPATTITLGPNSGFDVTQY